MTAAPLTPQDVFSTIPSDHRGTFVRLAEQRATAAAGGADPTPEQLCEAAKSIFAEIPEAARERFAKIAEQRAQLAAAASVRATAASLPSSPDQILRDAEAALAREQREEADETAWADARAKYGKGRVGRLDTSEGAIILRVMSLAEQDRSGARITAMPEGIERAVVVRECTLDTVVYPARARVSEITSMYPGLWVRIFELREQLSVGEAERIEGKA